ncbi:MAG: DUF2877 domain-containing protein [Nitrospinae bacterium]|nr:DUF2877 domain-containing protein [Nitrospinota bacterium]
MGGMIVALRSVYRAAGGHASSWEADSDMDISTSALAEGVVRNAAAGTTRISAALLTYAAEGVASAGVHRLVRRILEADIRSRCSRAAVQVAGVGHTSGWDCLAGLFVGMHIALATRDAEPSGDPRPSVPTAQARVRG